MYTLPGIPSLYYGSEFGIEGQKQRGSDDSLRPAISYDQYVEATKDNSFVKLISRLGEIRKSEKALSYGDYKELLLTTGQYAFSRSLNGEPVIVTVNNSDNDFTMNLPAQNSSEFVGGISGEKVLAENGTITVNVKANFGEIWLPVKDKTEAVKPIKLEALENKVEIKVQKEETPEPVKKEEPLKKEHVANKEGPLAKQNKSYEEMTVEELQEAILEKMRQNGPVTDQMRKDVMENVYHNSLVTWIKSFR